MARINVEDEWYADPTKRRAALVRAVAERPRDVEREADGLALDAWRTAQRYWAEGGQLIPEDVWKRGGYEPLIECGLAVREENGIYVRGAKKQHDWVLKKSDAGREGGKRSGETRRAKAAQVRAEPRGHGEAPRSTASAERSKNEAVLQQNEAVLRQNEAEAKHSPSETKHSPSETKPLTLTPALALALTQSPLLPPSQMLQQRQGASRRDFDRDADKASAEVLRAIEGGWGADHMRRDLSTTAQLLVAKRWGSLASFAETARVHRAPRDYEIFTSNLRRDFRALRQGLPAPPSGGGEETKRERNDTIEPGGPP